MPEEPPATSAGTPIPFNDDLKRLGVTKFIRNGDLVQIKIGDRKFVSFNIHKREFSETMERFKESALNGTAGLSRDIVKDMELILVDPDNGYVDYLQSSNASGTGTSPGSESGNENLKLTYATSYEIKTSLYEAVIIGGVPMFAQISIDSPDISLCTEIQIDEDHIVLPLPLDGYASRAYEFDSEKEFRQVEHHVRDKETLDTLFQKVKAQWNLYIDNGKEHNIMCAGDTIFTYFQDKVGTTHYDFFVGDTDSGKTANLPVFNLLAYRNIFTITVTAPNISQFLGSIRDGACTISEDEADDLDESKDKMNIYKSGYNTGIFIFRMDTTFGRIQLRLKTFCFKAYSAEKLPNGVKAKGFRQRCIVFICEEGDPAYDISEVIKTGGDPKFEQLLSDLLKLRNMLLMYRLIHYHDRILDLKLNIKGREKQLFKPAIRVFQNSSKTLAELIPVFDKYLSEYRGRRTETLEAALYKVVTELIDEEETTILKSTLIFSKLKSSLHGRNIPNKPMSFECEDFDIVYQGDVVTSLKHIFGAENKQVGINRERGLKFDRKKLIKISRKYGPAPEIKIEAIGNTHNTKRIKKSKIKPENRGRAVRAVRAVSGGMQGSFSQFKRGNSRGNQAQKQPKSAKNNNKNRPAYARRPLRPFRPLTPKKGVNP